MKGIALEVRDVVEKWNSRGGADDDAALFDGGGWFQGAAIERGDAVEERDAALGTDDNSAFLNCNSRRKLEIAVQNGLKDSRVLGIRKGETIMMKNEPPKQWDRIERESKAQFENRAFARLLA